MTLEQPDTARKAAFQDLLGVARHSILAYIVESSSPVIVDESDRRMMKLFQELYDKERHYVERAYELLDASGVRPLPPTYRLVASNFNFLRPMKTCEHWAEQVAPEIARLEELRGRVAVNDPCARDFDRLLQDFLALRREAVLRVAALRAELAAPTKA